MQRLIQQALYELLRYVLKRIKPAATFKDLSVVRPQLIYIYTGVISKCFNKGGSRFNVMKWVWPICSHTHIRKDGNMII